MSEQDTNPSSRLEATLLDQLARQNERICMLEARLEGTRPEKKSQEETGQERTNRELTSRADPRRQTEPAEHSVRAMSFEAPAQPVRAMSFKAPSQPMRAMSFEAPSNAASCSEPAVETALSLPAEREPIRLPEFAGPRVDAIAEVVLQKASERMRPVVAPEALPQTATAQTPFTAEASEAGYERTARMNAPSLRRRHQADNPSGNFRLKKAGSLALLSVAVAAMGVGLWQRSQSALLSASNTEVRPLPLLTPPAPLSAPRHSAFPSASRPLTSLPAARLSAGKTPVVEPESEAPAPQHHERRLASTSAAAPSGTHNHLSMNVSPVAAHSRVITGGSGHARQTEQKQAAVAATRAFKAPRVFSSYHRQARTSSHNAQTAWNRQPADVARVTAPSSVTRSSEEPPTNSDTAQYRPQSSSSTDSPSYHSGEGNTRRSSDEFRRAEAARSEVRRNYRRRNLDPSETSAETQPPPEEPPRRSTQASARRAMKTLDEMRDLLDSIERRKRRQAEADSQ